ncbi:PadR family transcriptional regulator [Halotia branconii]|uniref:PadR family transcriptional regulator n=1 Tax=Halotia branconii CENA392 TaxID=1539056 RepID=A0AAJ6NS14_9CYAN|nr:PadR family transcriptional regulator [Halotia branconii]WGV25663.1 PadR family transcriptional regulator [Halotia branconii CENA392]
MAKHQFLLSSLEQDLLTLLRSHNGFYGLEILNVINQVRSKYKIKLLTCGSLYTTLGRMETQNFITSISSKTEKTPRRRYYTISQSGEEALKLIEEYRDRLASWSK